MKEVIKNIILLFRRTIREYLHRCFEAINNSRGECELPQNLLREFAECLLPDIVAYCESEAGKKQFEEWKRKREDDKTLNAEKSKRSNFYRLPTD